MAWDTTYYAAIDSVDSTRLIALHISQPDRNRQRILKAEFTEKGHIVISTLLPMRNPTLSGEPLEWRINPKGDTLNVWCLNEKCDSTMLVLTTDEGLNDTLKLRYRAPITKGRRGNATQTKQALIRPLCDGNRAFYDSLMLAFRIPVTATAAPQEAEVMSLKDSTLKHYPILLDGQGMTARIAATLHSGEEYHVRIADSLFTDLYGHPSDSLNFKLTPKDYGILTLHITNRSGHPLVIEVLDKRDTVVQQRSLIGSGDVRFTHLSGGDYRLRAVVDADGNGRWTTGDFRLGRQPEKYHLFEKTLSLREKWEMEEEWVVGAPKAVPLEPKTLRTREGFGKIELGTPEMKKKN